MVATAVKQLITAELRGKNVSLIKLYFILIIKLKLSLNSLRLISVTC